MFHNFHQFQRTAAKPESSDEICMYDCNMCDSGDWLSETEVELHKKSMHTRQLYKIVTKSTNVCLTCTKVFREYKTVIEHIKTKHLYSSKTARRIEREIFICYYCEQIFFNKQLLALHIVHRHMSKRDSIVLNCPLCFKKKSSRVMYGHLTHHQMQSISICQICLRKQKNMKSLYKHLQTHLKHYHCNICGYISTKQKLFNMHLDMYERRRKRFEVKNYKEYFLHPCPRNRWSYNGLKIGLQGLVIYNELFICVLCRQLCVTQNEMQEHILRDHSTEPDIGETVAKKVCSCGEQFSNMIMLKHHIFKNKGQHRLSYTEIDQSAREESTDDEIEINVDLLEENPEQEIIYSYEFETLGSQESAAVIEVLTTESETPNVDTSSS